MLDTTYFFAASIVRAKGSIHSAIPSGRTPVARQPPRRLHHFVGDPAKEEGIGLREGLGPVTMQFFVRDPDTMIAAPVQGDVDGIPKGSHGVIVSPITVRWAVLINGYGRPVVPDKVRWDGFASTGTVDPSSRTGLNLTDLWTLIALVCEEQWRAWP